MTANPPSSPVGQPPVFECYRHPQALTMIRCQRCGRPICNECMAPAPVGFQCPECVAEGVRSTRSDRAPYGGKRSRSPQLTSIILIVVNVAIWGLLFLTGRDRSRWFDWLALLPVGRCELLSQPDRYFPNLDRTGCLANPEIATWVPGTADGAYWNLLSSAFTHIDLMHVGFNMFALWILGPQLEAVFGRLRFLATYLGSALTGSVLVYWLSDTATPTIGASGAIFGLMGALLVVALKAKADVRTLAGWIAANAVVTFLGAGYISWQGHLGGFVGGMLLSILISFAPKRGRGGWQLLGFFALLAMLVVAVLARTMQLT